MRRVRCSYVTGGVLILACALLVTGFGVSTIDIHKVDWANVSVPGSVCGATHLIRLHKGRAVVDSRRWPSVPRVTVDAGWNPVVYGNLDGVGQDEAALVVGCNNGSGTADGFLAYAQVIFTTAGKSLRVIGVVTPKQPRKANRLPTLVTVKIRRGKVIAQEAWYGPNDGTCCPSGRTTTVWTYAHGALRAGAPRITQAPSR
jgi:hypothetical protein